MNAVEFVKKFGWEKAKEAITHVAWCETAYCIRLGHGCFKSASDCCVDINDLKQIVEAFDKVNLAGGLSEAKRAIAGNYLNASYYMAGGTYLRYGAIGVRIVRDGEYKDYRGGIDSSRLVHLDYLPKAINLVEQCQ